MNYLNPQAEFSHRGRPPPVEDEEVLPGIPWGRPEWVPSPAFWRELANAYELNGKLFSPPRSLPEEVGFCILGGFGITAELNCAAHYYMRQHGVYELSSALGQKDVEKLLSDVIEYRGKKFRYRFPKQRSERLYKALARLRTEKPPETEAIELRNYLLTFHGIGPKTASWITRNWLASDDVAIIDIHVERAGRLIGLFDESHTLPRDYLVMERRFIEFSRALGVSPSRLDVVIWSTMRKLGKHSTSRH